MTALEGKLCGPSFGGDGMRQPNDTVFTCTMFLSSLYPLPVPVFSCVLCCEGVIWDNCLFSGTKFSRFLRRETEWPLLSVYHLHSTQPWTFLINIKIRRFWWGVMEVKFTPLISGADPRFPRWGGVGVLTYYLPKCFPKTAWKWKKVDRGGVPRPLDPPMNLNDCDLPSVLSFSAKYNILINTLFSCT